MNESVKSPYDQKVESIANELSEQEYEVILEPSLDKLPFDLGSYKPDLVALKDKGGIILEVKSRHTKFSVDRFQELAERIAAHEGWRFLVVTLDDITETLLPKEPSDLPSVALLQEKTRQVETLIQSGMVEPALLYLWSTIEGLLRKRAIAQEIPIYRFPLIRLLDHMYSSGEISIDEFDLLRSTLEKRDGVAHGLVTSLTVSELEKLLTTTRYLIEKWQEPSPVS